MSQLLTNTNKRKEIDIRLYQWNALPYQKPIQFQCFVITLSERRRFLADDGELDDSAKGEYRFHTCFYKANG